MKMEKIIITRPLVGEHFSYLKPISQGETLSGIYPHKGDNGKKHKGNMTITQILGHPADKKGCMGWRGIGKCVMSDCEVTVEVEVAKEK